MFHINTKLEYLLTSCNTVSRRQREGSYTSKPPRHDGERRYRDDRDRDRRHPPDRHRDRDRYETRYRDIDPSRKYGNLRKEREDDRKRGQ